jgi:predicted protein tyrosine phosphatase
MARTHRDLPPPPTANPFRYSGPLRVREDIVDRENELAEMLALVRGGHSIRLIGPRRYGKTTLLGQLIADAERAGMATALVDLEDVLSIGELVVRIERAYAASLKGGLRSTVEALFNVWNVGLSLSAGGFTARLSAHPATNTEAVLLRLLGLPRELHERTGQRTLVVFDEVQDILAIRGADGKIRSVIQHHDGVAAYAFAGSAPGLMDQLFADPKRPLLEQAVAAELAPLPLDMVAEYIAARFHRTSRQAGTALQPVVEFTRGHPQRTMLLAHCLWQRTPEGDRADEATFAAAQDEALRHAHQHLRAIFKALTPNEKRVMIALANLTGSPREAANARAVGLNPNSSAKTLEALRAAADVFDDPHTGPTITDPLFELWLRRRGLAGLPTQTPDDD